LRSKTLSHWARQYSRGQILELLVQNGAPVLNDTYKKKPDPKNGCVRPTQPQPKVNEKKQPKRYVLTALNEEGHYEPITLDQFEEFRLEHPDLAKYFDGNDDDEENEEGNGPIDELEVPELPEGYPVYAHWEEAAKRILQNLSRAKNSWLFAAPVDAETFCLKDYHSIIKNPMDFGTIKAKIKDHKYTSA